MTDAETTAESGVAEEIASDEGVTEGGVPEAAPTPPVAVTARATNGARPNRRKIREGIVVSSAMEKTAVVAVIERVRHARYSKTVQRTKRIYVHDGENALRVGDRVRVAETRPLSKLKHWRLVEVLEHAR